MSDGILVYENQDILYSNAEGTLLLEQTNNTVIDGLQFDYSTNTHQQVGDECIKAVAGSIRHSSSQPNDLTSHFGGEEFVIILPDTDMNGAIKVSQIIKQSITELKNLPLNPFTKKQLSLSIEFPRINLYRISPVKKLSIWLITQCICQNKMAGIRFVTLVTI